MYEYETAASAVVRGEFARTDTTGVRARAFLEAVVPRELVTALRTTGECRIGIAGYRLHVWGGTPPDCYENRYRLLGGYCCDPLPGAPLLDRLAAWYLRLTIQGPPQNNYRGYDDRGYWC